MKIESGNLVRESTQISPYGKFETGKKFDAEIVGIEQSKVTIKLDGGSVMTVSGKLPKNVVQGDVVSFLVKSNEDGVILIETVKADMAKSLLDIVKNALNACEMYPTDENINLVKSIAANNLPMDADTIQKAAFGYYSLKNASMDELVFILQEKLPINEKTLDTIDLYINNKVSIQKDLDSLTDVVTKMSNSFDKMLAFSVLTENESSRYVLEVFKYADSNGMCKQLVDLIKDVVSGDKNANLLDELFRGDFKELPFKDELVKFVEKMTDNFNVDVRDESLKNKLNEALNIKFDKNEFGEQLSKFFQALHEKTSALGYIFPNEGKGAEIKEATGNVKSNIEFMNEINNYKMYLQLPLVLNGNNTQADLYFFKNPRSKKVSKDNATVMLSLNLANLGHIDTLIHKKGNIIDLKFFSENNNVSDKIKKNIFTLGGLLSDEGYVIGSTSYAISAEKFNLLSSVDKETVTTESFTFDIKA